MKPCNVFQTQGDFKFLPYGLGFLDNAIQGSLRVCVLWREGNLAVCHFASDAACLHRFLKLRFSVRFPLKAKMCTVCPFVFVGAGSLAWNPGALSMRNCVVFAAQRALRLLPQAVSASRRFAKTRNVHVVGGPWRLRASRPRPDGRALALDFCHPLICPVGGTRSAQLLPSSTGPFRLPHTSCRRCGAALSARSRQLPDSPCRAKVACHKAFACAGPVKVTVPGSPSRRSRAHCLSLMGYRTPYVRPHFLPLCVENENAPSGQASRAVPRGDGGWSPNRCKGARVSPCADVGFFL